MDALYFRVSSDRQTSENQFQDLLAVAEKDGSPRDWGQILTISPTASSRKKSGAPGPPRTVYRVNQVVADRLADQYIYVEQGKSGRKGARSRPMFERMKRDAALRKFDRLLVWKVSRLGRDMREVISTVYELADAEVTVVPVKSQTGAISSTMGKLLWAIQAWFAEMENEERVDAIKAGHERALALGKRIGRPRMVFDRDEVVRLRDQEDMSWSQIASKLGVGATTVRRAYRTSTARRRAAKTIQGAEHGEAAKQTA